MRSTRLWAYGQTCTYILHRNMANTAHPKQKPMPNNYCMAGCRIQNEYHKLKVSTAQPFYRCVSTNRKNSIRLDSQQPSVVGKSKRLKRTNPSHCTSGVVAHRVSFSWQLLGSVLRMFKAEAKLTLPALIAWSFIKCILRSKDSRPLTCQYAWLCQFVNSPGYSIE